MAINVFLPYASRPPGKEDAADVASLIAACQKADGDEPDMTVDELLGDWERIDLGREAVLVTDSAGRVAAYADLVNRNHRYIAVYGYVHPEHRSRGLGGFLIAWAEKWIRDRAGRAPVDASVVVDHYVRTANRTADILLTGQGYVPARTFYIMRRRLDTPIPRPIWPTSVSVRTFIPAKDDRALFEAGEEAFKDTWTGTPGTFDAWLGPTRTETFDPMLWFLAVETMTDTLAGFCLCQVAGTLAWISSLGVRPRWRKQGIGRALLLEALCEFAGRGFPVAELSVDSESPTGAPRLYTSAGMQIDRSYTSYRKELIPGRSFDRSK